MFEFIKKRILGRKTVPPPPPPGTSSILAAPDWFTHSTVNDTATGGGYTWQGSISRLEQIEVVGPGFLEEGDTYQYADDVRHGDVVWVDRSKPEAIRIRLARKPMDPRIQTYRVERTTTGAIRFQALNPLRPELQAA